MANIQFGAPLRNALIQGIRDTARVVVPNYGPLGRNTLVQPKTDIPMFLSSGGKILEDFSLEDPVKCMGSQILCDGVKTLAGHTGDGVSGAVVLCNAMVEFGSKALGAGANPIRFRRGMEKATQAAVNAIWNRAVPLEAEQDVYPLALHVTGDQQVARILAEAWNLAEDGKTLTIEDSQQGETRIHAGGIRYGYGWMANEFANDETGTAAKQWNPYVLLADKRIENIYELQTILEQTAKKKIPLLMIVKDMKPEVLRVILMNVKRKSANIVVATAPGHGQSRRRHMEALAAKLGAVLVEEHSGLNLKNCGLEICGRVEYAQVDRQQTYLRGAPAGNQDRIQELRRSAQNQLAVTTDAYEREKLQLTLAILAGQTVTISVGGTTEVAMFEQKHRLENGLAALVTAQETGVLPGGGKGFLLGIEAAEQCMASLEDEETLGAKCVAEALTCPLKTIAENTGKSGALVEDAVMASEMLFYGFDGEKQRYVDLRREGILDPAGSVVGALMVASETAATVLTAEAAVYPTK